LKAGNFAPGEAPWDLPDVILRIFLQMPGPLPLNKTVRQTRGKYLAANHGEFYLQDCPTFGEPSNIRYVNLPDLETMARELGALADGETVNA
jgi:hypothetical protein